jgi:hypothetical protein
MYATGTTLNPGRRVGASLTRLTTKPDCPSRISTLQSAHWPVRGQPGAFGVLLLVVADGVALATLDDVTVEMADPALSDSEREHAASVIEASTNVP